jgi:hypothetical protein
MKNLIKAVNAVMSEVSNIEKNLNVGAGKASYKGVADKDVKYLLSKSMQKHGLAMFPIKIDPKLSIERWQEETNYGPKQKQQVFSEVLVTYKLIHESGEAIELQGYGHGVDSQDKSAGKATTYAMKYALLYTFMIATGEIDDADATHSDATQQAPAKLPTLTQNSKQWPTVFEAVSDGRANLTYVKKKFTISKKVEEILEEAHERAIEELAKKSN